MVCSSTLSEGPTRWVPTIVTSGVINGFAWGYKHTLRIQTHPDQVGLMVQIPSPCHRIGSGKSCSYRHTNGSLGILKGAPFHSIYDWFFLEPTVLAIWRFLGKPHLHFAGLARSVVATAFVGRFQPLQEFWRRFFVVWLPEWRFCWCFFFVAGGGFFCVPFVWLPWLEVL